MISTVSILLLSLAALVAMFSIGIGLLFWLGRNTGGQQRTDLYESDYLEEDSFRRDDRERPHGW